MDLLFKAYNNKLFCDISLMNNLSLYSWLLNWVKSFGHLPFCLIVQEKCILVFWLTYIYLYISLQCVVEWTIKKNFSYSQKTTKY